MHFRGTHGTCSKEMCFGPRGRTRAYCMITTRTRRMDPSFSFQHLHRPTRPLQHLHHLSPLHLHCHQPLHCPHWILPATMALIFCKLTPANKTVLMRALHQFHLGMVWECMTLTFPLSRVRLQSNGQSGPFVCHLQRSATSRGVTPLATSNEYCTLTTEYLWHCTTKGPVYEGHIPWRRTCSVGPTPCPREL